MLIVDANHNHPVMKAFIILLKEEAGITDGCKHIPPKDAENGEW